MNDEIIRIIADNLPAIITTSLSLVGAVTALILAIAQRKSLNAIKKNLDEAKARETYSVCPHCHEKIYLSEMKFYLPGGKIDNDLDGKED